MLESLPAVLVMDHYGFDYHYPLVEVPIGDETILIAADVENQDSRSQARNPCSGRSVSLFVFFFFFFQNRVKGLREAACLANLATAISP